MTDFIGRFKNWHAHIYFHALDIHINHMFIVNLQKYIIDKILPIDFAPFFTTLCNTSSLLITSESI